MIRLLSCVLLILMLPTPAPAEDAAPDPISAREPLFRDYSAHDFCLDMAGVFASGKTESLEERLSVAPVVDGIMRLLPENFRHEPDSTYIRITLKDSIRSAYFVNIRELRAAWSVTGFTSLPDGGALCTLTSDGFMEKDEPFYAARLTLARENGRIVLTDIEESLFTRPLSQRMTDYYVRILAPRPRPAAGGNPLSDLLQAPSSPRLNVFMNQLEPDNSRTPVEEMMSAIRIKDKALIISIYENRLDPASRRLEIFQQHYLNTAAEVKGKYPEALARVVRQHLAGQASGFRLDLAYLEKNNAEILATLDSLEEAWGHHPGMDVLRIRTLRRQGMPDAVRPAFIRALDKNDGYSLLFWEMMRFCAAEKRYDDALSMADILTRRFDYRLENPKLGLDPDLKDFASSPVFRNWLKKTGSTAAPAN